jgi:predicted ATPase/DNA-binding winged helix-turn-helix (wHTH) protein
MRLPSEKKKGAAKLVSAAAAEALSRPETVFAFGRYRLFIERRRLMRENTHVELGSRAFEIMAALVEGGGGLVSKAELRKRAWPNVVVEQQNLDAQIHALRKALGPDRDIIQSESGRGYRLALPVQMVAKPTPRTTNVPAPMSPLVGRSAELNELVAKLGVYRLVTLTGAGGIGKTQLALELARRVLLQFTDGAWIVELGPISDPELVPTTIARTLGIEAGLDGNLSDRLTTALQRRHLLLILDNCEQVVEAASRITETLLRGAPRLHVLATSREPLSIEGEQNYPLAPLSVPRTDVARAADALEHSAVRLFVERARAADPTFSFEDCAAAVVSRICRRLDGIPLAIELAAARVATLGLDTVARRLSDGLRLLTGRRRGTESRHRTLTATLDWSYGLLTEPERAVFRRMAIFAGSFTLEAAGRVVGDSLIDPAQVPDHVGDLVRKSLVSADLGGMIRRYRMLETTHAYALDKLMQSGEFAAIARRRAEYYRDLLEQATPHWLTRPASELVASFAGEIENIRNALSWACGPDGDGEMGVALAAAAIPLWTLLSVLGEYRNVIARALARLGHHSRYQIRHEMLLQTALARSSIWAEGPIGVTGSAATRALEIAGRLNDAEYKLRALYILWVYRYRIGEYRAGLSIAKQFRDVAEDAGDVAGVLTAARLEGGSFHHLGDQEKAQAAMKKVVDSGCLDLHQSFILRFGLDQRVIALSYLARILWLQGSPDQALAMARASIDEAKALSHANTLCLVLCDGACAIAAMSGDLKATEEFATHLIESAEEHGMGIWHAYGIAFKAWLDVKRGDMEGGLRLLTSALGEFRATRVGLHQAVFTSALAEALGGVGRVSEGLAVIDDAMQICARSEGHWRMAELLRMKGEFMLRYGLPDSVPVAQRHFERALELARRYGIQPWQLRAATSLARLWRDEGRRDEALVALAPIYESFTEGHEGCDLKTAKDVIDSLQ